MLIQGYCGRGNIRTIALRKYESAIADFDKAIEIRQIISANALNNRGNTKNQLADIKRQLMILINIKLDPDNTAALQ